MSDIFISYVEEDSSVATQVGDGLQAAGYSTWLYERDSLPGPAYLLQMGEAIDQAPGRRHHHISGLYGL